MQDRGRPEVALVERSADFEIGGGAPSRVGQHNWFVNFGYSRKLSALEAGIPSFQHARDWLANQ